MDEYKGFYVDGLGAGIDAYYNGCGYGNGLGDGGLGGNGYGSIWGECIGGNTGDKNRFDGGNGVSSGGGVTIYREDV